MTYLEKNTAYADAVIAGQIPAGRLQRLACERFIRDVAKGKWIWCEKSAAEIVDFCGYLRHYKGEWAGKVWVPEPWQIFILTNIFGWKRADGRRRFRQAYIEVPRKNGKTFLGAAIALFGLTLDMEKGAEVYSVATKKDQAKLLTDDAGRMVGQSASLRAWIKVFKTGMVCEKIAAKFQPLGRDSKSLDGLNPHMAILDEFHAWKGRDLFDVIRGAFGARLNWLLCIITTAGFNVSGICYERRRHCEKLLSMPGQYDDEEVFAFIAAADEGDDPFDPKTWAKANPNLGVSKSWDYMRGAAEEARLMPAALSEFLAKQLDIWVSAATAWVNLEAWRKCALTVPDSMLAGCECWGALDLAPVNDLSSVVLCFTLPSGRVVTRTFAWCPGDDIDERSRIQGVPYRAWEEAGHIVRTDGNVTDFETVKLAIFDLFKRFNFKGLAYDPSFAGEVAQWLNSQGVPVVPFRQGFLSMGPAVAAVERSIMSKELGHDDNPLLNWAASNVTAEKDAHGNQKFVKPKDRTQKIDPMVCLAMAMGLRALRRGAAPAAKAAVHFL